MRFRLPYEGELKASGRDPESGQRDRMTEHKQAIRKVFHAQLKQLRNVNKLLKETTVDAAEVAHLTTPAMEAHKGAYWGTRHVPDRVPLYESVADLYKKNGYRFVPLVREDLSLFCSLDISLLRRDFRAGAISAGDLDNRIKTLIDALRKPHNANELGGNETPGPDEDPFFCLLEDDDPVTTLTVRTYVLVDPPPPGNAGRSQVKLVVSAELKPDHVTMFNLSFAQPARAPAPRTFKLGNG